MARGDTIRELDEQMATLVRRAVDDLRVQVRSRLEEATAELQRRLGEVAPDLPESFISDEHVRRIADEVARPTTEALDEARAGGEAAGRAQAHGELRAALAEIDRARGQADVLAALLDAVGRYAQRAVVLLVRDGRLGGWGARGFESDDDTIRGVSLGAEQEPWSTLHAGGPARVLPSAGSAGLVSQLDSPLADQAYAVPMVLRDRVAAVVYADRAGEAGRLDVDAVQVLVYAAALALETLTFREREQTATLRPAERPAGAEAAPAESAAALGAADAGEPSGMAGATEPAADWTPPSPPPAEAPEEIAAAPEEAFDLGAPDEDGPVRVDVEEEPEIYDLSDDTELELEDIEVEEPQTEVEIEALPPEEALAFQDEPGEIPTREYDYPREPDDEEEDDFGGGVVTEETGATEETVDASAFEEATFDDAPELEPEEEPVPSAETVAWSPQPVPADDEEAPEELVGAEPEVEEPEVELEDRPEAGAVPPPAPTPPSAAGPVEPPAGVEGPGWAFSAPQETVSKDEEAAHEEARRLARLLVSEIQLYNQDEVEEGRRNRDIYERLRDDIDRSRQLYEDRVDSGVRENTDYFYQELVRQLAAGDAKALGI